MNWIDIVILIILGFAVVRGFINGFVKEVAALAALVFGIWGTIKFSAFTAGKLYEWFDISGKYVGIIAFLITFGVIVIVIHFVGILADKIIDSVSLGFLNKILGMLFGLIKTVLILSVIFCILNAIDAKKPFLNKEKIGKLKLYNPISDIVPAIFPILGEGNFNQSIYSLKKKPEEKPEGIII